MSRFPRFGWLIAFVGVNMVSSTFAESLTAVPFQDVKISDDF
jgi:hypothetical protein